MNCLMIEQAQGSIMIDCGVTFPHGDLGIDVVHPRFDHVLADISRFAGVVLTHGHEDHIGALPYLLSRVNVPVWGPPCTLELVRQRLSEHGLEDEVDLRQTTVGERFVVGPFEIEPLRVTHSIADATALAIQTTAGLVVHTGDFKLDPNPIDGELTSTERFEALGNDGVRLLLSDSTNVDTPGTAPSEKTVCDALTDLVMSAKQRVFVGMFASNAHRLIALGEAAQRSGRRIVLLGRSVGNHARAVQNVGRVRWPSDLVVAPEVAAAMPRERVLAICGGTQAERGSSLARLAEGVHPTMRVDEGDRVLLSSRVIPGNERAVSELVSAFLRRGADLVTWALDRRIHASGHAHREEQEAMLTMVRPRAFIPVHGTLHHLMRHADVARSLGVSEVLVAENGEVVELTATQPPSKVGRTVVGRVATFGGDELPDDAIRERAALGRAGAAFVTVPLDARGAVASRPEVAMRGLPLSRDETLLRAAARAASQAITSASPNVRARSDDLADVVRLAVRKVIEQRTRHRPIVTVLFTRV
ncbi:MAG: ribonuclease J [Polyangiaceae bacterium]|nr:ribonuclease J [Polyangiaceae bacterium]